MFYSQLFRDVDEVQDMMDDIEEQNQKATEISEAISRPLQDSDDVSQYCMTIIV